MPFTSLGKEPTAPATDSARGLIVAGILLVSGFFAGLGGWAAVARLDSAVVAAGVVAVEGNRKPVQHRDGGLVKEILVQEGGYVRAGDPLLRLDDTELQASRAVLVSQIDSAQAREARLIAERSGNASISFPERLTARAADPRVASVMQEEEKLFAVRQVALQGDLDLARQKIVQFREQIAGAEAQKASRQRQLALINEEFAGQKELFEKGLVRRTRIFELQRTTAALEGSIGESQATIAQARESIRTTEQEVAQIQKRRAEEVANSLKEAQQKIAEILPRLSSLDEQIARSVLAASDEGYVMGLSVAAEGNVLKAGEKVADLVPSRDVLAIDTQVHPEDIEDLRAGMRAEIHLLAYKDMNLPEIAGTVTRVSPDRLQDPRTGMPYYAIRIAVADPELLRRLDVRLQPGMPVSVLIPVGARTVLDYLIWPIRKQLQGAFREK